MSGESGKNELARVLTLKDATMLVVSSVIGSGIFLTPGRVADLLPHPGLILAAWLAGGLLSLAGALANAELGAMFPHAGGDYVYLREAFHPAAGFLVGWLTFFVIYAGSIATLATATAEALAPFVPGVGGYPVIAAIGATLVLSAINYRGVRAGALLNNVAGTLKLVALAVFIVAGPILGRGSVAHLRPVTAGWTGIPASAFGVALSPILFTYLGWNAPVYVASELRDPARNLPRSLFLGLGLCAAVYLLVNAVYLYALPVERLRGTVNVGAAAAEALFGPAGGALVGVFVLVSVLGTLDAMILVGPRVAYAMALDGLFFAGADRVHPRFGTPHRAIVVQAVVVGALLAVLRTFPSVLDYTTFAIVLATMADTAALYALRRRRPALPRPYRAWGYPLVPGLYLVANAAIAAALLAGRTTECVVGLGVLAAGWPFYAIFARWSTSRGLSA
jgi:APA family basic amino acid/polyamine antiporter